MLVICCNSTFCLCSFSHGKNVGLWIVISSLFDRFHSNYLENGHGFKLLYESTDVSNWSYRSGVCGGNLTTQNGFLASPGYPENYPNEADCIYTISQPPGTIIHLKFHSFKIEHSSECRECSCDFLEIRDGGYDTRPVLGKLCGYEIPPYVQSTQNQVWLK